MHISKRYSCIFSHELSICPYLGNTLLSRVTLLRLIQSFNYYLVAAKTHFNSDHINQPAAAAPVTSSGAGHRHLRANSEGRRPAPSRDGDGTAGFGGGRTLTAATSDTRTDCHRHQGRLPPTSGQTTTDTRADHHRHQEPVPLYDCTDLFLVYMRRFSLTTCP